MINFKRYANLRSFLLSTLLLIQAVCAACVMVPDEVKQHVASPVPGAPNHYQRPERPERPDPSERPAQAAQPEAAETRS